MMTPEFRSNSFHVAALPRALAQRVNSHLLPALLWGDAWFVLNGSDRGISLYMYIPLVTAHTSGRGGIIHARRNIFSNMQDFNIKYSLKENTNVVFTKYPRMKHISILVSKTPPYIHIYIYIHIHPIPREYIFSLLSFRIRIAG